MRAIHIYLLFFALLISCSSTATHKYKLKLIDNNGEPLTGARVDYTLQTWNNNKLFVKSDSTNTDGEMISSYEIPKNESWTEHDIYESMFIYRVLKDGYYSTEGTLKSYFESDEEYRPGNDKDEIIEKTCILNNIYHVYEIDIEASDSIDQSQLNIEYKLYSNNKEIISKKVTGKHVVDSIKTEPNYEIGKLQLNSSIKGYISYPKFRPILIQCNNDFGSALVKNQNSKVKIQEKLKKFYHLYQILVVDQDNQPLKNALVEYSLSDGILISGPYSKLTNDEGMIYDSIAPRFKEWNDKNLESATELKYTMTKFGYDTISGSITSLFGDMDSQDDLIRKSKAKLTKKSYEEIATIKWDKVFGNVYIEYFPERYIFLIMDIYQIIQLSYGSENGYNAASQYLDESLRLKPELLDSLIFSLKISSSILPDDYNIPILKVLTKV